MRSKETTLRPGGCGALTAALHAKLHPTQDVV